MDTETPDTTGRAPRALRGTVVRAVAHRCFRRDDLGDAVPARRRPVSPLRGLLARPEDEVMAEDVVGPVANFAHGQSREATLMRRLGLGP
jgi:hypothetical protein